MTPDQIRDAIGASAALLALVPDTTAIAAALSVGRTRPSNLQIGKGTVLETLGLTAGNAFLDVIEGRSEFEGQSEFRHVRGLVAEGRLVISSPLVMATVQALVPAVLTQPQADSLLALAYVPDGVGEFEVRAAIFADDGTLRV